MQESYVKVNLVHLKIRTFRHFTFLFLLIQLNPEHTVPTLVDDDFVIWDSHAICMYLADKYSQNDKLYPKDLQLRAKCNQRLFFDAGTLYTRLRDCSIHIFYNGGTEIGLDKIEAMHAAYSILELFLASDPFLVGNNWTIADVSVAMTTSCLEIYAPVENDKYPKIFAWLKRVSQTIPFFDEINSKPLEMYRLLIRDVLAKNKQK